LLPEFSLENNSLENDSLENNGFHPTEGKRPSRVALASTMGFDSKVHRLSIALNIGWNS